MANLFGLSPIAISAEQTEIAGEPGDSLKGFKSYPVFQKSYEPLQTFVPKDWTILDSISCHLSEDSIKDLALVIEFKNTVNELLAPETEFECKPRILLILLRQRSKPLFQLLIQNNLIVARNGMGRFGDNGQAGGDPYEKMKVKKKVLSLIGSWGAEYKFRCQNGDIYLIGATDVSRYDRDYMYVSDLNFLTGKGLLSRTPRSEDGKTKEKWIILPKESLIKLRDINSIEEVAFPYYE